MPDLKLSRTLEIILLVVLLLVLLVSGLIGIDLGTHWDEPNNLEHVSHSLRTGVMLPTFYNYPTLMYWLIVFSLALRAPAAAGNPDFSLLDFTYTTEFLIQTRIIFLVVSLIGVVAVYALLRVWRGNGWLALLGAALLGLSWEVAYHIRWVTPDGLMMAFAALTLCLTMIAFARQDQAVRWLKLAMVAAGLTTGAKYTAGLLILPVYLALLFTWEREGFWRKLVWPGLQLGFIFLLTYLITTPGTLIDPINFAGSIAFQQGVYGGGHELHTVETGFEHISRMIAYFGLYGFSRYALPGALLSLFVLPGVVDLFRRSWREALVLLSFPLLYFLYFGLTSRVMIVRNLLVLFPYLAVLAALGVAWTVERLADSRWRMALSAGVGVILLVNAGWLLAAANSIRHREDEGRVIAQFVRYAEAHPGQTIGLTPSLADRVDPDTAPNLVATDAEAVDQVAFLLFPNGHCYPPNRQAARLRWFGSDEINIRYYPTFFPENPRIVLLPVEQVERFGMAGCLK